MSQRILSVTVVDSPSKPMGLIKREMVDLDFHERGNVHPQNKFTLLAKDATNTRFRQEVKIFGLPQVDEVVLRKHLMAKWHRMSRAFVPTRSVNSREKAHCR
jgi:hypothetical protein